jgi:MoaA/NifB/PqqE/SkfB family radical SAM enzyme
MLRFLAAEDVTGITIAGGEPLLSDLLDLTLRTAKELGLWIALHTNATAPRRLEAALPFLDWLCLPLDGASAATTRRLRTTHHHRDHFSRAVALAEPYRNRGLRLKVGTVITRENVAELGEIASLLHDVAPDIWKWYELRPRGKGRENFSWLSVEAPELLASRDRVRERYPELAIIASLTEQTDAAHLIINPDAEITIPQDNDYLSFGRLVAGMAIDRSAWSRAITALDRAAHVENVRVTFPGDPALIRERVAR